MVSDKDSEYGFDRSRSDDELRRLIKDAIRLTKDLARVATPIVISVAKGISESNWERYKVSELDDKIVVEVELPGAKKDSVKVFAKEGMLYVRAERDPAIPGEPRVYRVKIRLPDDVDVNRARAKYVQGLLLVEMPRKSEGREIPVE